MPRFNPVDPFPIVDGEHSFGVWDCGPEQGGDLIEELAEFVRDLYVKPGELRDTLLGAVADLGGSRSAERLAVVLGGRWCPPWSRAVGDASQPVVAERAGREFERVGCLAHRRAGGDQRTRALEQLVGDF
jgi:hypothetical protein